MFCKRCIEQCLTTRRSCPVCRQQVRGGIREFPPCKWATQLSEKIEGLTIRDAVKLCETHPTEMASLYCGDCSDAVCGHCILDSGEHHGHSVSPLQTVAKELNETVVREREKLNEVNTRLLKNIETVRSSSKTLKSVAASHMADGDVQFKEIVQLLVKERHKSLVSLMNSIRDDQEQLEDLLFEQDDNESTSAGADAVDMIHRNAEFLAKSQAFSAQYGEEAVSGIEGKVEELVSDMRTDLLSCLDTHPPFSLVTQTVYDYRHHCQNNNLLTSDQVVFCDMKFRVNIQCGNQLQISLMEESESSVKYSGCREFYVQVTLVNQFGAKDRNRRSSFLVKTKSGVPVSKKVDSLCLSYDQMIDFGFLKPAVDVIVVRFAIRPLSYQVLSRIQHDYIARLSK